MRKIVKVNYPKKRPRLKLEDLGDVAEPERHSMFEILLENLKIANRATFLHRIIYVGEHFFLCFDDAREVFEKIIIRSNETYCLEKLTGFFLFYPQFFVHMVEGDEDNLNKHLGFLLAKKAKHASQLGLTKLLIHVSHINQRFFDNWVYFTAVPPKLLEKLDTSADMIQSGRYIYNCIKKVYSLIGNYADDLNATPDPVRTRSYDAPNLIGTYSSEEFFPNITNTSHIYTSFSYVSQAISADRSEPSALKDYKLFLPEYELLEFIVKSSFTMTLKEYYGLYGVVPMRDIYKDRVWPVPHDFIPFDVFEKPYDCATELPKDSRRKRTPGGTPGETPGDTPRQTPTLSKVNVEEETKENEGNKMEKAKET